MSQQLLIICRKPTSENILGTRVIEDMSDELRQGAASTSFYTLSNALGFLIGSGRMKDVSDQQMSPKSWTTNSTQACPAK